MLWKKVLNLYQPIFRFYCSSLPKKINKDHNLAKHLAQKITVGGPITIADYMKEVLTNPASGYYMNRDVFGERGDFITSPEITQMFGEMVAIWTLNEWQKFGSPKPLQFVELGPGRGTLSHDILNVFEHFNSLHTASLNLVEVSPYLSEMQAKKLCKSVTPVSKNKATYRQGASHHDIPVNWYKHLNDVPKGFSIYLAHEFFDALPIYKFHMTYSGYREILIDCDITEDELPLFKYVLSKNPSPMCKTLIKESEKREHVEVSVDTILIVQEICKRLVSFGGMALFCDYGHNGEGTDTFRAFKQHKQVHPLQSPGSADLTADVDFNLIKEVANKAGGIITLGPVTQRDFLLKVGLQHRFNALSNTITDAEHLQNLEYCYDILIDEQKMGKRFKFMALFPETMKKIIDKVPVVGFS